LKSRTFFDKIIGILVNGKEVNFDYTLKNTDRVQVITKGIINPKATENKDNKRKIKSLLT